MPIESLPVGGSVYLVQFLENSADFLSWAQDIKSVVLRHKVWTLIDGTEKNLEKPERPTAHAKVEEREAYQRETEEFKEQLGRITTALGILHESIHTSIRTYISQYESPQDAFNHLKSQYEPNKAQRLIWALNNMENIVMTYIMPVTELTNLLRDA